MAGMAVPIIVASRATRKVPKKRDPITIKKGSREGVRDCLIFFLVAHDDILDVVCSKLICVLLLGDCRVGSKAGGTDWRWMLWCSPKSSFREVMVDLLCYFRT